MKKILMVMLLLTACDKASPPVSFPCEAANSFKPIAVNLIATNLSCSNTAAISASLDSIFIKFGVCHAPAKGIFSPLCDLLVAPIIDKVFSSEIPASWACTGGASQAVLTTVLMAACSRI